MVSEVEEQQSKRKRGRLPKTADTLKNTHSVRLDDEEEVMLACLETKTGDSKSDIIRRAFRGYYVYLREVGIIGERE